MATSTETVDCEVHGEARVAFVCRHLIEHPQQRWFCDYPSSEQPWPDAWCEQCEKHICVTSKESDSREYKRERIPVCCRCYEENKGESVAFLMGEKSEYWQKYLEFCNILMGEKQKKLQENFDIGLHKRWNLDQNTGKIVFSNDGVAAIIADFQLVGSFATRPGTWLWSWANINILPERSNLLLKVRDFGEEQGLANLTVPKWPAEEADGWEMASVASNITHAAGVYRGPTDKGYVFLLLFNLKGAQ